VTPPAELGGRLHPLAILVVLRRFVGTWILPLLVVALTWRGGLAIPGLALIVGAGLAYGVLTWLRFTYAVVGDRLEIRQGVFERKVRVVPVARIRGVDVSASALHRLLGLVRVEVEAASGGSSRAELTLAAVTRAEGEALRLKLLVRDPGHLDADVQAERSPRVLFHASPALLAAGGVTSGRYLLAPLAVVGVVFNLADDLPGSLGDRLISSAVDHAPQGSAGRLVLVGVVAVAAATLAALGSLLIDWNFTVHDEPDRLVATRGLVTHRAVTIERGRIRGVDVTDSPLRRVVGLVGAAVVAGGLGGGRGGRASVAPVIRRRDVVGLLRAIDPHVPDPSGVLVGHPRAALARRLLRAVVLPAAATAVAAALGYWWAASAFALLAGVGIVLGRDRYRQLGHRWDGTRLAVREGSLTRRWTALDPSAVVSYEVRRSPGQARAGLCTIVLHLGQGVGARRVLDVSDAQARALLERLATPLLAPLVAQ
jgi:uncharacterized membrane protein YdbT with pleckstrin-like domain